MTGRVRFSAALVLALLVPAAAEAAPHLRAHVTVSGPVVRLGDLVEGAGALGQVPLFRSPDLGYTGPVPASDVVAAGEAAGLAGIETDGLAAVEVSRASRLLTTDDLLPLVQGRLAAAAGLPDPAALQVSFEADSARVALPVTASGQPTVVDAAWSPVDGHFQAVLAVRRRDGGAERRTLTGTAVETAAVVVAARDLSAGSVVGAADVEVVRRPRAGLPRQSLSASASAVGLEARRAVRAGEVIRAGDLGEPELVKRGDVVTVILSTAGMTLTVRGQALRDGRRGDLVTVRNLQSKRVLEGTVTGTAEVTLIAASPRPIATALR
jgi:flagella basal body P-ring formation protein FlgA